MREGTPCVKILDLGSGIYWYYDPRSRCAQDPQHFHAGSPYMTDQTAFLDCQTLASMQPGDVVFVESHDRFYATGTESAYAPGRRVWRKCEIIETTAYPGRRSQVGRGQ